MTGIAPTGSIPVAGTPLVYGTQFLQTVDASLTTSTAMALTAGKLVAVAETTAVTVSRAIAFTVNVLPAFPAAVLKAVDVTLAAASVSAAAAVFKNVGKAVVAPIAVPLAFVSRNVGKIVTPIVDLEVSHLLSALFVTSRMVLQDAVDFVLAATQPIEKRGREFDLRDPNIRTKTRISRSGVQQLGGGPPSFTVKTSPKRK